MSDNRHLELMQLFDGELDTERAAELQAELSVDDQAVLDGLSGLGDMLRAHADVHGSAADGIADDVLGALDADADPTPASVSPMPLTDDPGKSAKGDTRRGVRQGAWIGGLALAAAAAAVLLIRTSPAPTEPVARAQEVLAPVIPSAAMPENPDIEAEPAPAAAIESVDFGSQSGAIFMVPAGTETTPVVWLTDEAASGGDGMESL